MLTSPEASIVNAEEPDAFDTFNPKVLTVDELVNAKGPIFTPPVVELAMEIFRPKYMLGSTVVTVAGAIVDNEGGAIL